MKRSTTAWLMLVFLASGFAALLYQVVWQRSLFAIYGINIESVTVVITAFMLGLGFGFFGLVSLPLFHWVGGLTLDLPPIATAMVTLLLVLFPTMLMGGTLPL